MKSLIARCKVNGGMISADLMAGRRRPEYDRGEWICRFSLLGPDNSEAIAPGFTAHLWTRSRGLDDELTMCIVLFANATVGLCMGDVDFADLTLELPLQRAVTPLLGDRFSICPRAGESVNATAGTYTIQGPWSVWPRRAHFVRRFLVGRKRLLAKLEDELADRYFGAFFHPSLWSGHDRGEYRRGVGPSHAPMTQSRESDWGALRALRASTEYHSPFRPWGNAFDPGEVSGAGIYMQPGALFDFNSNHSALVARADHVAERCPWAMFTSSGLIPTRDNSAVGAGSLTFEYLLDATDSGRLSNDTPQQLPCFRGQKEGARSKEADDDDAFDDDNQVQVRYRQHDIYHRVRGVIDDVAAAQWLGLPCARLRVLMAAEDTRMSHSMHVTYVAGQTNPWRYSMGNDIAYLNAVPSAEHRGGRIQRGEAWAAWIFSLALLFDAPDAAGWLKACCEKAMLLERWQMASGFTVNTFPNFGLDQDEPIKLFGAPPTRTWATTWQHTFVVHALDALGCQLRDMQEHRALRDSGDGAARRLMAALEAIQRAISRSSRPWETLKTRVAGRYGGTGLPLYAFTGDTLDDGHIYDAATEGCGPARWEYDWNALAAIYRWRNRDVDIMDLARTIGWRESSNRHDLLAQLADHDPRLGLHAQYTFAQE